MSEPVQKIGRVSTTGGSTKEARKMARQLASVARDRACAEWIADYHLEIIQGRDPRVTMRDRDPSTNLGRRGRPSSPGAIIEQLPSLQESMVALQQYLLRRDGQAPRKEELDRDVARDGASTAGVDLAELARRPPAELRELVRALRVASGQPVPAVPVAGPTAPALTGTPAPPASVPGSGGGGPPGPVAPGALTENDHAATTDAPTYVDGRPVIDV